MIAARDLKIRCPVAAVVPPGPSNRADRRKVAGDNHTYSMRRISFLNWLEHRPEEVPDAAELALAIARSGAAGVSFHDLRRQTRLLPDTLNSLLAALLAGGQVTIVSVGGELRYRATG